MSDDDFEPREREGADEQDNTLDWSAPAESLARVESYPDRSPRPMVAVVVLLGVIVGGWLWTMRPQPAEAVGAPVPSETPTRLAPTGDVRVIPAPTPGGPQRIELFELPAWDDAKG